MKARTITHEFIVCPNCGKSEHQADHIKLNQAFGPWYCDEEDCGRSFTGTRTQEGFSIDYTPTVVKRVLVELVYRDDPKLRIITQGSEYKGEVTVPALVLGGTWPPIEYPDHHEYYFNEHTCPTNYFRGVEKIIYGDDADPHGVFQFVRVLSDEEAKKLREE